MDLSKKVIVVVCLVIAVLCGGIIAATLFSEPESIDEVNITNKNSYLPNHINIKINIESYAALDFA